MKKVILSLAIFFGISFFLYVNIDLLSLKSIEVGHQTRVDAAIQNYVMSFARCAGGGTYDRCIPQYDEECCIDAQTVCM